MQKYNARTIDSSKKKKAEEHARPAAARAWGGAATPSGDKRCKVHYPRCKQQTIGFFPSAPSVDPLLPLPPITTGAGTRAAHVTSTQLSESHQRAAYLRAPKELYGSLYA